MLEVKLHALQMFLWLLWLAQ